MESNTINLDRLVDYRAEYSAVIENYKINGNRLVGLCPFHQERHPSFSVNLETGQWNCFTEGEGGNFVSFWAKYYLHDSESTTQAYKEILEKYGVSRNPSAHPQQQARQRNVNNLAAYTLEEYAQDKKLPADWLHDVCGLSTYPGRNGWPDCLQIPYRNINGETQTFRKRYAKKEFRWWKGSAGKICLYGEWRIPEFLEQEGWAVLVEGESDTHSLWYMGIPAIGVAGADMFKEHQTPLLQGLKLYIHKEPDEGGETFLHKTLKGLRDGDWTGEIYRWQCSLLNFKDPSDVYMVHGREEGAKLIRQLLEQAEHVNIEAELMPEVIPGAPIHLRQPEGFIYSDKGISSIDPKTMIPTTICRTPIILTQRLKNIETKEEKIEVAFKRDGEWSSAIYSRDIVFSSRGILNLTKHGCTVTSENARKVVQFLGALEMENIDVIPRTDATSTFGWQPGGRFLPGKADNLVLDVDASQRHLAAAYCQNGTLDGWIQTMAPHRNRDKFRFILAASFAAPLLRIVKQRTFIVYNWGNSKGGKTAALKAALSAWGNPEKLMASFNATQVGLERIASFYCDLPLGIDERQLAGDRQNDVEKKIYMLASGQGRLRGEKAGGLQTTYQWRTAALCTGEEPVTTDTSMTGVSTVCIF